MKEASRIIETSCNGRFYLAKDNEFYQPPKDSDPKPIAISVTIRDWIVAGISCPNLKEDGKCKLREGKYFSEECMWSDPGSYIGLIDIHDRNIALDEAQSQTVSQDAVSLKAPNTLITRALEFLRHKR